jgi:hypothetical protein
MHKEQFPHKYPHEPRGVKEKKAKGYPSSHPPQIPSKEEWHHEQRDKLKKPKPDPATVEAELQREEDLWNS